ncbi:MAG: tol-pal system-associated acyl-CoA thioesterase [Xanthomonadales bacterium]|nr:tol-pal system-associated acyl-CoA thioesterase [Xanthomonadales bacterium]
MSDFSWKIRVYYEDTDAGGVVYHSQYLNFFERARTEWLRARKIDQSSLSENEGIVFVVRNMDIEFIKPAKLDNEVLVSVSLKHTGAASLQLAQTMIRDSDQQLLAKAEVRVACLTAVEFKPTRIPKNLRKEVLQ